MDFPLFSLLRYFQAFEDLLRNTMLPFISTLKIWTVKTEDNNFSCPYKVFYPFIVSLLMLYDMWLPVPKTLRL